MAVTEQILSSDAKTNPKSSESVMLGRKLGRCKLRKFSVAVGADQDEIATGITSIVECAWRGATALDYATPTWDPATGGVTFNTAGAVNGTLYVWSGI